jgi:hypothetical protein
MEVWPNTEVMVEYTGYKPRLGEIPYKFKEWKEKRGYAEVKA